MKADGLDKPLTGWRLHLYTIIFKADTCACRRFDQWLIDVRILRLLRWVPVFKLTADVLEYRMHGLALRANIVTAKMPYVRQVTVTMRSCHECLTEGRLPYANYCRQNGARLSAYAHEGAQL